LWDVSGFLQLVWMRLAWAGPGRRRSGCRWNGWKVQVVPMDPPLYRLAES